MAAAAGASSADNDTECFVCHELFKNPKLLPCAHVLCRHCLLSWLASNPEALCPLCRGAIADPKEKSKTKGWEEVVDVLPDDVAMAALVESTRVLSQDHVCVGCKSAAVSICLNCNDMMCKSCGDLHTKFSATRDHKVEDLSSMTAEELAASQPDHCSVHTSKPCEVFCPTHGAAICHLCASAKHRACPDLTELAEAADKSREELSRMVTSLLTEEQQLEEAVAALERHLEATEKVVQEAVAEIDRTCDQLENSVKECRRRVKKVTLDTKAKVKDTVLAVKVTLLDHRGRLTSHRRGADRITRGSTNKGICDVTRALRDRVKDILDTCCQRRADLKLVSMFTLTIDAAVVSRIEKELSELGQVKISPASVGPVQEVEEELSPEETERYEKQVAEAQREEQHKKALHIIIRLLRSIMFVKRLRNIKNLCVRQIDRDLFSPFIITDGMCGICGVRFEKPVAEAKPETGKGENKSEEAEDDEADEDFETAVVRLKQEHLRSKEHGTTAANFGTFREMYRSVLSMPLHGIAAFMCKHEVKKHKDTWYKDLPFQVTGILEKLAGLHRQLCLTIQDRKWTEQNSLINMRHDLVRFFQEHVRGPIAHHYLAHQAKTCQFIPHENQTAEKARGHTAIENMLYKAKTWQFIKSENIVLSNENRTAEKARGHTAIVLSSSPMEDNMLYEVQIDTTKGKSSDFFPCGVVKSPPDTLKIPITALDGWTDAVVFSYTVFQLGSEKDHGIADRLRNLKEGTRVGFVRGAGGCIHLYIDGGKQGIYARNVPKDCYVFFELLHIYQQVTALPMTVVKKALKRW